MKFWVNWRWLYIELALPQWIHIDPKMSPVVRPEKSEKIPSEPAGYLGIWWFTRGFSWFFPWFFHHFFSDKRYIYIYHMIIRFEIRCCYIFSPIFPYGFHMFPTFSYVSHVFFPCSQQPTVWSTRPHQEGLALQHVSIHVVEDLRHGLLSGSHRSSTVYLR